MMKPSMCNSIVCFDLDDTLYKEIDFVQSAFKEIATWLGYPYLSGQMMAWHQQGKNVFLELNQAIGINIDISDYLYVYRNHLPVISLSEEVIKTLDTLISKGVKLGLITDGRSISQRNKIKALELNRWFLDEDIIISEEFGSDKTNSRNFVYFMDKYPHFDYSYVGDNPIKDFKAPNQLGWRTIQILDDGRNIHNSTAKRDSGSPQFLFRSISSILSFF